MKLCAVIDTDTFLDTGERVSKIRVLNSKEELRVPNNSIVPVNTSEPSDIL